MNQFVITHLLIEKKTTWVEFIGGETAFKLEFISMLPKDLEVDDILILFEFNSNEVTDPEIQKELKNNYIYFSENAGWYRYLGLKEAKKFIDISFDFQKIKVLKIGFRLWKSRRDVVLRGFKIYSRSSIVSHPLIVGLTSSNLQERSIFNLLINKKKCTDECEVFNSNILLALAHGARVDYGYSHKIWSPDANASGDRPEYWDYSMSPATLVIPSSIQEYRHTIGDASRNVVKKADALGFIFNLFDPAEYLEDIREIRTSSEFRQGKKIPDGFYKLPIEMGRRLDYDSCALHREVFFGLFDNKKLVSYCSLFLGGEIAEVNQILGHRDYLRRGVMNLLIYNIVNYAIDEMKWLKGIVYLYISKKNPNSGLNIFKRSMGFISTPAVITTSQNHFFANKKHGDEEIKILSERRKNFKNKFPAVIEPIKLMDLIELKSYFDQEGVREIYSIDKLTDGIRLQPLEYSRLNEAELFSPNYLSSQLMLLLNGGLDLINEGISDLNINLVIFFPKNIAKLIPEVGAALYKRIKSEVVMVDGIRNVFKGSKFMLCIVFIIDDYYVALIKKL